MEKDIAQEKIEPKTRAQKLGKTTRSTSSSSTPNFTTTQPSLNKPRKLGISVPLTAVGCVLLLVIAPWLYYLNENLEGEQPELELELTHEMDYVVNSIMDFAINNATELILSNPNYNQNITFFKKDLDRNLAKEILERYQPFLRDKNKIDIRVTYWTLEIQPQVKNTIDLLRYPDINDANNNKLDLIYDFYTDSRYPFSYSLTLELFISARMNTENENGGKLLERIYSITESLDLPHLFIEYKLWQFQNNAKTAYSDLAKMIRYILTTLARMRAYNEQDFENAGSHKKVLSEGDVELALNLALVLEEALLFRAYEYAAVSSIDRFYYNAGTADENNDQNPTGKRQWGSSEIENYYNYLNRRTYINNLESRSMTSLINQYLTTGYIDPADIFGLYLILDKNPLPAIIGSPKDTTSILDEKYSTKYLTDPQTPNSRTDTTNLKHILYLPTDFESGFNFTYDSFDFNNYQTIKLSLNQEPNYLVQDYDYILKGLDDGRGWYSTAVLRPGTDTRTSVVIPVRPEEHSYRLAWNLRILGSFELNVRPNMAIYDSLYSGLWFNKKIELDLPINIFLWFNSDPYITSVNFEDFNKGTATADAWEITSESMLVYYFEKRFWEYLSPFFGLGFDQLHTMMPYIYSESGFEYYFDGRKRYLDTLLIGDDDSFSRLVTDILLQQSISIDNILSKYLEIFWSRFNIFMSEYFLDYLGQYDEEYNFFNYTDKPQFPHPPIFPWIAELGYDINLHYSKVTNICNLTLLLDKGYITMLIYGYNTDLDKLKVQLITHIDVPSVVKLHTTLVTGSNVIERPQYSSIGVLYDTYHFQTQTYSKPITSTGFDSNEVLLLPRSQFGEMNKITEVQLENITIINSQTEDHANADQIIIRLYAPVDLYSKLLSLGKLIDGIPTEKEIVADDNPKDPTSSDRIIQDRVYLAQYLSNLTDTMIKWIVKNYSNSKFVLDLSMSSKQTAEQRNLTLFFAEPLTAKKFLTWFGESGVEFFITLRAEDRLDLESRFIESLLDKYSGLTIDDLENMDFEIYSNLGDYKHDTPFSSVENILESYQYPSLERHNIISISSTTGKFFQIIGPTGLFIGAVPKLTDQQPGSIEIFKQDYYCYKFNDNNNDQYKVQLLVGINWYLKIG